MNLEGIRDAFPVVNSKLFMNHAGVSPCSRPVREAITSYLDAWSRMDVEGTEERLQGSKALFAELTGAKPEEVALTPNTSYGLAAVANALTVPKGDNVVTTDLEYPSVVLPWLNLRREQGLRLG